MNYRETDTAGSKAEIAKLREDAEPHKTISQFLLIRGLAENMLGDLWENSGRCIAEKHLDKASATQLLKVVFGFNTAFLFNHVNPDTKDSYLPKEFPATDYEDQDDLRPFPVDAAFLPEGAFVKAERPGIKFVSPSPDANGLTQKIPTVLPPNKLTFGFEYPAQGLHGPQLNRVSFSVDFETFQLKSFVFRPDMAGTESYNGEDQYLTEPNPKLLRNLHQVLRPLTKPVA
jgi:hypothetical protein